MRRRSGHAWDFRRIGGGFAIWNLGAAYLGGFALWLKA
jgi:hypothetical protein